VGVDRRVILLQFADGSYPFALGLSQINEIEAKCGCGLGEVFARILSGRYLIDDTNTVGAPAEARWKIADLMETIRQGLIGGMALAKARVDGIDVELTHHRINQLIQNYVVGSDRQPLAKSWTLAASILQSEIEGYDTKKKEPSTQGEKIEPDQSSALKDMQEPS
jgi:hypothetical protein